MPKHVRIRKDRRHCVVPRLILVDDKLWEAMRDEAAVRGISHVELWRRAARTLLERTGAVVQ